VANWGSWKKTLDGITGEAIGALPSQSWTSQTNPRRLQGNGLIDVPSSPNGVQTFAVTLSPILCGAGGAGGVYTPGAPIFLAAPGTAPTFWRAPKALVRWGRGGIEHSALVDWPWVGGTFAVTGDSLFVDAWALDPDPALATEPQSWDVQLGAHASVVGPGGQFMPPRCTMKLPTPIANAGGTSGDVLVPTFARRWQWNWNNRYAEGAWVVQFFYRRWGVTIAQELLQGGVAVRGILDTTIPGTGWDLPTGTQTMVVLNSTVAALPILDGRLVFSLDLGG
jgi:hypothetical protein